MSDLTSLLRASVVLERELDALKARYWRGETCEALAAEIDIDPEWLRARFVSTYTPKDVASTPDEVTYIPGDEL